MVKISKVRNIDHYFNQFAPDFVEKKKSKSQTTGNEIILEVPFAEKDEAKSLGAKWNPELKKWYIPDGIEKEKFNKWIKSS